ncbi:MAG: methyltransferase domain-containing protein [Bacteroidales bacterium]|nr:methyltransferase domain-containing protein [Bacteroidales bacterium]
MGVFRFKRFEVVNERSAMKVNTDGVLLGAAMTINSSDRVLLDIGTGTGTIALMAAQRFLDFARNDNEDARNLTVHAIDIDAISAEEAAMNFSNSPWSEHLQAHTASLDEYAASLEEGDTFDLIFSNPPYFDDSLGAPEQRRNTARHTSTGLSYREILDFAAVRLSDHGRVAMVLPSDVEPALLRHARMNGLHLFRILRVRTVERKQPSRIIAEFSRTRCDAPEDEILTIQKEGRYSHEYLALTHGFYLFA